MVKQNAQQEHKTISTTWANTHTQWAEVGKGREGGGRREEQKQQILSLSRRIGVAAASSVRCQNKNSTNTRRALALPLPLPLPLAVVRSLSLIQSAGTAHSLLWQGNTITNLPPHTHTHRDTFCLVFSPGHQLSQVSNAFHRLWSALVLVLVLLLVLQSTGQRMCVSRFKSKLSRTRHGRTGSGSGNDTRSSLGTKEALTQVQLCQVLRSRFNNSYCSPLSHYKVYICIWSIPYINIKQS